ncbi:MAG: RIP metalloprotease RseP [Candidatus Hydrogenedentota bacterium]
MLLNIVVFLVVLGVLIFFHELGHFLAAKSFGIYCERFSLGMPPRLWGVQWGETDYCIGMLPIGGYVKMAGQEDAPRSEEEQERDFGHIPKERWFSSKPPWQRAIVLVAGPLMNLILGFGLYALMVGVGAEVPEQEVEARVGEVEAGSPAENAPLYKADSAKPPEDASPVSTGWQTGDRVLAMDGSRVDTMQDVLLGAILSGGEQRVFRIERTMPDGSTQRFLSPLRPRESEDEEHPRFGVRAYQSALIDEVHEGSPADQAGLKAGDIVRQVDGREVDTRLLTDYMEKQADGEPVELTIERDGERLTLEVTPQRMGRFVGLRTNPPITRPDQADAEAKPEVVAVSPELKEQSDILSQDIIIEVEGEPATAKRLYEIQQDHIGERVELTLRRPAIGYGILRSETVTTAKLEVTPVGHIGVTFGPRTVFHRVPLAEAPAEAARKSYQAVTQVLRTVQLLATRDLGMGELGGPVMIYQVTTAAAEHGHYRFLQIMAFISINLCIFNLLPLPVLDGGQLVFVGVEAIRRKPVSARVFELTQMAGLFLIVSLILFVTYNDILRLVNMAVP